MRLRVLAFALAGALAAAGAAAAQNYNGYAVNAPEPPQGPTSNISQSSGGPASEWTSRRQRYLMRLQSLHEWLLKLKARDGGQLSDDHAALLQRQLDKLNRIYGKG